MRPKMLRAYLSAIVRAFDQPAYLGLDRDAHWAALIGEGVALYGTHYAGSRLADYCPPVYAQAEDTLAAWLGAPRVSLVSSGSLLATLVVDQLLGEGYIALAGPFAHACWRRPGVIAFAEEKAWRSAALARMAGGERLAVISDSVCAIRCRRARLEWLRDLPPTAAVVLDDSHALAVLGPNGRASWAEFSDLSTELIVCASLGKSFSVPGAVMVSGKERARRFRATAAFGGASSIPPAYVHAIARGLPYALGQRGRVLGHVTALEGVGLLHAEGHPAFLLDKVQGDRLTAAGIAFAKTHYPTAESPEVSRLVVSAAHTAAEVAAAVRALAGL